MTNEILVVKKDKHRDRMKFKVANKETNRWSPSKYEKIIINRDTNLLAYLFFDLNSMGYNVDKAYAKYKELLHEPELFFLK